MLDEHGYSAGAQGNYELLNWRAFEKFGSGIIGDLGSHQVDIFNWFFGRPPVSIQASGGRDFHTAEREQRLLTERVREELANNKSKRRKAMLEAELEELGKIASFSDPGVVDNVMSILDYETPRDSWRTAGGAGEMLRSRVNYKILTTTGSGKFHEKFMGEDGALEISELSDIGRLSAEWSADQERWKNAAGAEPPLIQRDQTQEGGRQPLRGVERYRLPDHVDFKERPHTPHLRNFFATLRDGGKQKDLNCPATVGFQSLVTTLKLGEAVVERKALDIAPEEFAV